jgi:hypothetical protein
MENTAVALTREDDCRMLDVGKAECHAWPVGVT